MAKQKLKRGRPVVADKRVSCRVGMSKSEFKRVLEACVLRGKEFSPLARELLLDWALNVKSGKRVI